MVVIFTAPFALWRLLRTDHFSPLVIVQFIAGIVLGPGVAGRFISGLHEIITREPFTALLLMAVVSTDLTVPFAAPRLQGLSGATSR